MDNSNMSKNRPNNEYLGVNKAGKNIRKSPLHQPNFANSGNVNSTANSRQQTQPQVYNISKNDFRSIVQQLTGSPSREPLPRPPHNPPKSSSSRLQKIRPPPLAQINRPIVNPPIAVAPAPAPPPRHGPPMVPAQHPSQGPAMAQSQPPYHNNFAQSQPPYNNFVRSHHFSQPSPPLNPNDSFWVNPALSPLSAYMQQLQRCINDPGARPNPSPPAFPQQQYLGQFQGPNQPPPQYQVPGQVQAQPPSSGLLPNPSMPPLPSPRMRNRGPALLPSPNSQFLLPSPGMPSPSSFMNLLSPTPRSPYPLLSPGSQFLPPLSPNFSFPQMGQSGILGPGPPGPQSASTQGLLFPPSPSGFFPLFSPRWRDQ